MKGSKKDQIAGQFGLIGLIILFVSVLVWIAVGFASGGSPLMHQAFMSWAHMFFKVTTSTSAFFTTCVEVLLWIFFLVGIIMLLAAHQFRKIMVPVGGLLSTFFIGFVLFTLFVGSSSDYQISYGAQGFLKADIVLVMISMLLFVIGTCASVLGSQKEEEGVGSLSREELEEMRMIIRDELENRQQPTNVYVTLKDTQEEPEQESRFHRKKRK